MAFERFDAELQAILSGQPLPKPTETSTAVRVLRDTGTTESELSQMTDRLAIFWDYREESPEKAEAYWVQVQRNFASTNSLEQSFEDTVLRALHVMGVEIDDDIRSIEPYVDHEHKT